MKTPRYLSPTSFTLFQKDPDEYYRKYLSDRPFVPEPQTLPMAVGSAFDYKIKKHLIGNLGTRLLAQPAPFELQIDPGLRDQADAAGEKVLRLYTDSGALNALLIEITHGARFEFKIEGNIRTGTCVPVPLHGRPDAFFATTDNVPVVLDWKVNGWCAPRTTSPKPGYVQSYGLKGSLGQHKSVTLLSYRGVMVSDKQPDPEWSTQLCFYSWLLGNPIGSAFIGAIDQICGPADAGRVAKHRFLIGEAYQMGLWNQVYEAWGRISGRLPYYPGLTDTQQIERFETLDAAPRDGDVDLQPDDSHLKRLGL